LMADAVDTLVAGLEAAGKDRKPLLYGVTGETIDEAIEKLADAGVPVGVTADGIENIVPFTEKLKDAGIQDVVVDTSARNVWDAVRDQIFMRRAALKQAFRPLGYPTITFPCFMAKDLNSEAVIAASLISRYAGLIVLSDLQEDFLFPLVVLRMNIYTDPRVPMAVEAKVYEFSNPGKDSPVVITTNFALTYFSVANEVEATKVPTYLAIQDTEGLSVLTAWSTGKFNGETAGEFMKKCGIEQMTDKRKIIIPGLLARIKGELEDELPGWEVIVGPREAAGLSAFLPEVARG